MKCFSEAALLLLCLGVAIEPLWAATCTISKYNENDIKNAATECTDITLNGIEIPPGVGLNMDLRPGTKLTFQGRITWGFFEWKGPLVNITGINLDISGAPGHVLDVRGQLWWDGFGEHGGTTKPLFFVLHETNNTVLHDLNVTNTPYHAFWIEQSDGVIVHDINIDSSSGDTLGGHNTDGFNIWKSNNVTLQHITVQNQDDCITTKSGTNIVIKHIYCSGGHGLSIGSVGGRDYNIVENLHVSDVEIVNSENGVRIKTVSGATGSVANVTYEDIVLRDIRDYGIIMIGDYNITTGGRTGVATGGLPITHLTLRNVTGTVVETGVNIFVLVKNASDWRWSDINVTGGKVVKQCEGIPEGSGFSC